MSGVSEAAPFTVTPTSSQVPVQPQQLDQQMRVPYATDGTYRPVGVGVGPSPPPGTDWNGSTAVAKQEMNLNSGDQKRKRGRPRKYGPDGSMAITVAGQQSVSVGMQLPDTFSPASMASEAHRPMGGSDSPTTKKARGRPPGSSNKKKQIEAIGLLFKGT